MTRDELTALRDVLDLILRLPDDLRAQVAAWLAPAAPKPGNGLDPHPPPVADARQGAQTGEIPHSSEAGQGSAARRPGQSGPGQADPGESGRAAAPRGDARQPRIERQRARPYRRAKPHRQRRTPAPARPARHDREGRHGRWRLKAGEAEAGPTAGRPLRRRPCRPDGGDNTWEGAVKFIRNKGEALIALSVGMVHFRSRRRSSLAGQGVGPSLRGRGASRGSLAGSWWRRR